jgi:alpha-tubulin suppressor-like RCC1 family protein
MSALLKKEFRLLLPAWIAAMLLAIAPFPLGKIFRFGTELALGMTSYASILGCLILGMVGFGREFESRTFSLFLVQPWQRREFWRAKIIALLVALLPLALWLLVLDVVCVPSHQNWSGPLIWLAIASAVIAGGLWTTLLLRQFFSAFWLTILLPLGIVFTTAALWGERTPKEVGVMITCFLLMGYSIAGYFLARWLFRTAQDTQWTGGELSLASVAKWLRWKQALAGPRKTHPLWALFGKEIHLHESSFLAAGLLLVAQIAALLLSRFAENPQVSVLGVLPTVMWCLWLLMPALVGCASVAEERKLGTFETQLCLPASRARQFGVKVFVTLALGVALGAVVPIMTAPFSRIEPMHGRQLVEFAWGWTLVCLGITIVCFYASSLARYALHAFAVAVAFIALWSFLLSWLVGGFVQQGGYFTLFGHELWRGPLAFLIAAGVMLVFAMGYTWRRLRWIWVGFVMLISVLIYRGTIQSFLDRVFSNTALTDWEEMIFKTMAFLSFTLGPTLLLLALAARNFKHTQTAKHLWLRNGITWAGCLFLTIIVTPLVYNRVWEVGMAVEPPASPPRLSGSIRPMIAKYSRSGWILTLLPDGRLSGVKEYNTVPKAGEWTGWDEAPWREIPVKHPRPEFVGGSNWISVAASMYDMAGVKSDGSLWSIRWWEILRPDGEAETAGATRWARKDEGMRQTPIKVERIGNDSDWKMVAGGAAHFIAIKRNGTVWGWGENRNRQLGAAPPLVSNSPVRIGSDSGWSAVFAHSAHSLAVKQDGSVWKWGAFKRPGQESFEVNPVKLQINFRDVRSVVSGFNFDLFLNQNGNIAISGESLFAQRLAASARLSQALSISRWSDISFLYEIGFAGIKDDGTLWVQPVNESASNPVAVVPGQLGKRSDWIALLARGETIIALAKDGTLCRFGKKSWSPQQELLAPTRRVTWNVNVLEAAK